jgi:hypothetical protein
MQLHSQKLVVPMMSAALNPESADQWRCGAPVRESFHINQEGNERIFV